MSGFEPEPGSEAWERERANVERGSEAWERLRGTTSPDGRKWYTRKRHVIPAAVLVLLIYRFGTQPRQAGVSIDTSWGRSVSSAGLDTAERPMGFEECNGQIRTLADQLGITPSNIVDSNAMRVVRFNTADGSVLVTCDAIDDKVIIVKSPSGG